MAFFSNYSEEKIYRRTKFIIFNFVIAVVAVALTLATVFFTADLKSVSQMNIDIPTWGYLIISIIWFYVVRSSLLGGWLGKLIVKFQRLKDAGRNSKGGNARFVGMFEEALNLKKSSTDIYFGRSLFNRFWSIGSKSDKHMLTIGGTRSGKGACCIIPNLLTWSGSVFCIDPKGTNTHVTAERRRRMGQTVHVLDPFHLTTTDSGHFNPLDFIDPTSRTAADDIKLIVDALIPEEPDSKQPHFTLAAKAIFSGYIVHVLTSGLYKNPSLIDAYNIIHSSGDEWIDTHANMMANTSCSELAKQASVAVKDGIGRGEHHSVISTMKAQLSWLASEVFSEFLSRSTFSFGDMKDKKTSIYLVIPPKRLNTSSKFLRLIVSVAINRYSDDGKAEIPGLFIIDEAAALGYLHEIQNAYSLMGSYNLKLWTFFQHKGQLDENYGAEAKSFFSGSRAIQLLAIVQDDAEWVAAMLGTRSMVDLNDLSSASSIMGLRDPASVVKEIGDREDKDLAKAQYIIRTGKNPMKLDMLPYFRSYRLAPDAFRDPDHPWPPHTYTFGRLISKILGTPANFLFFIVLMLIFSPIIAFFVTTYAMLLGYVWDVNIVLPYVYIPALIWGLLWGLANAASFRTESKEFYGRWAFLHLFEISFSAPRKFMLKTIKKPGEILFFLYILGFTLVMGKICFWAYSFIPEWVKFWN